MRAVWFLVCVLGARGAADLFDAELHRAALQPALCARQLAAMRRADFYDASFRAPEGLLVGNLVSLGNYHQCLGINQDFPDTNIQGKYCLIRAPLTPPTVRIPSLTGISVSENVTWTEVALPEDLMQAYAGKSLSLAVCVPKSCAVEAVLAPYTEHPVLGFNYTEQYCRLPHDKPFVAGDYVAMIIFSVIGLLTVISTAYELRHIFILKKDPSQASELYRVCSLYTNTRRLLTFDKPRALDCLDGIRCLSILLVILFHTYFVYFYFGNYVINSFEVHQWLRNEQAVWILSSDLAVDSFFTMSGLLLVYTSIKKMTQASLLQSLHWYYLNRFLRLFPLLGTAVLLQASLLHRVADGPGWHSLAGLVSDCRRYWWSALLHVQNFVNPLHQCVPVTWYLSLDMQLHVVSPLVLYWVLASRRAAWTALAAGLIVSLATTLAICFTINYYSSISMLPQRELTDNIEGYLKYYYYNLFARASPFFVGMVFGYILHIFRDKRIQLPQRASAQAGRLKELFMLSMQPGWDNHFMDSMNNSFRRPAWALALCWMILACVHGYGGPVHWFLSLRLWKLMARVSYAMYLFHQFIQKTARSTAVTPVYFTMGKLFTLFASDLMLTLVVSTVACVLIEEPALTLHRMLLQGIFKRQRKNEDENKPVALGTKEEHTC